MDQLTTLLLLVAGAVNHMDFRHVGELTVTGQILFLRSGVQRIPFVSRREF